MRVLSENRTLRAGAYTILKHISSGGFGIIYKAVRNSDRRVVCIKEFYIKTICKRESGSEQVSPSSDSNRPVFNQYLKNYLKEAQILMSLNHPHIVRVWDVFEENGTAYYVMEYIDGTPLSALIPSSGLALSTTGDIMHMLCDAVGYLHEHHITHLDIKPSNIMVRGSDDIVLIDFGGSKSYNASGEQTSSSPASTSEGFAPIELYTDRVMSTFCPASDVYELGATLYKMSTGQTPPPAVDILDQGNPIDRFAVPTNFKRAILAAMEPGLKKRIQSVSKFEQILFQTPPNDYASDETVVTSDQAAVPSDETVVTPEETVLTPGASGSDAYAGAIPDQHDGVIANDASQPGFFARHKKTLLWSAVSVVVLVLAIVHVARLNAESTYSGYDDDDIVTIEVDSLALERSALEQFVSKENAKTHRERMGLRIDSLSLTDNSLIYNVSIGRESRMIYDELKKSAEATHQNTLTSLRNDYALLDVCRRLQKLDMSLTWNYYLEGDPGSRITTVLTADELANVKAYEGTSRERTLQQFEQMAQNTTRQCPQTVDDGLVMTACDFEGSNIVYRYSCSEEYYDYIASNRTEWQNDMAGQLTSEPLMKAFIDNCAKNNINIQYAYKNKSSGKVIKLTYDTGNHRFINN